MGLKGQGCHKMVLTPFYDSPFIYSVKNALALSL